MRKYLPLLCKNYKRMAKIDKKNDTSATAGSREGYP